MTKINKYSVEWYLKNKDDIGADRKKLIEGLKNGANIKREKDVNIPQSLFLGDIRDAKKQQALLMQSCKDGMQAVQTISQFGGINNVFKILDENGDGKVTIDEIKNISQANTSFFAEEVDEYLSANDLKAIYDNAMQAAGGEYKVEGNVTNYTYKNGIKTKVSEDENGDIHYKYIEGQSKDGGKLSIALNYDLQTLYQNEWDEKGRIITTIVDSPGANNDRAINITYDDENNSRSVESTTAGTKYQALITQEEGRVSSDKSVTYSSDGVIGNTKQQSIGDCWVLSGVNALASTPKGAQLIKNSIKHNPDGSVTVKLKGANRSYTFSADEVGGADYVNNKYSYAKGDTDMNLLEMAITRYRQELIASNPESWKYRDATMENPIDGGLTFESLQYITGKKPEVSFNSKNIAKMLAKKEQAPERYAAEFSFRKKDESIDNGKVIITGHAYSLSRVTSDTVYIINPWDSSKEIAYPIDKFLENCDEMAFLDMNKVR